MSSQFNSYIDNIDTSFGGIFAKVAVNSGIMTKAQSLSVQERLGAISGMSNPAH